MLYLLIVSLIWAFSFGLIKGNLTGLDSNFVSFARMAVSLIVFLPFLRIKNFNKKFLSKLVIIGAVQYGLMYISYIYSYQYLQAYEVALFTIFTPLYISITNDILEKKFHLRLFISAVIAIIGAGIITYKGLDNSNLLSGFLILQISNVSFAFGQIYYKRVVNNEPKISDLNIFGLLYFGAVIITGLFSFFTTDYSTLVLSSKQVYTLLYLGIIASGLSFFLWNIGARKTSAGTLAVFNNLKIPLGIAVSLFVFGEQTDTARLAAGSIIIFAAFYISSPQLFFNKSKGNNSK